MKGSFVIASLLVGNFAGVRGAAVQKSGLILPLSAKSHQDAVKNIFLDSYNAYK